MSLDTSPKSLPNIEVKGRKVKELNRSDKIAKELNFQQNY
jgi:hypothetical protein